MPSAASAPPPTWLHHLEDEADAAYLYRELARLEPDRRKSELYQKLASVEDRHVELWRTLLAQNGHSAEVPAPSRAARFRAWVARRLGSGFLLPMLLEEEGRVAGMIGAQSNFVVASHAVVVAGLAGAVADALSMGSSGYLAAKSEREVFEHEIKMEKEEIRLMPDLEREELSLLYQAKGIPQSQAEALATQVMSDPERALEEKVREELKIGEATSTPMREAWITGIATALGALIPVAPLLVSRGPVAVWSSFVLAMFSHFGVGAARSIFTGRGVLRSGMDMFLVGLGVAGVGYLVGDWIVKLL
jgi:VIT1/CCC1 family predicted Fe2+/Mn2+ transporter